MRRSMPQRPDLAVIGCSTSGEITPEGIAAGHLLAILLPACHFTVVSATIPGVATAGMDTIAGEVDRLKRALGGHRRRPGHGRFALCLIDGMSFAEERGDGRLQLGARRHPADRRLGRRRPALRAHAG